MFSHMLIFSMSLLITQNTLDTISSVDTYINQPFTSQPGSLDLIKCILNLKSVTESNVEHLLL